MRKARQIRLSLSVLDAAALELGKMLKDTPRMELYSVIIAEVAGAGFRRYLKFFLANSLFF